MCAASDGGHLKRKRMDGVFLMPSGLYIVRGKTEAKIMRNYCSKDTTQ